MGCRGQEVSASRQEGVVAAVAVPLAPVYRISGELGKVVVAAVVSAPVDGMPRPVEEVGMILADLGHVGNTD